MIHTVAIKPYWFRCVGKSTVVGALAAVAMMLATTPASARGPLGLFSRDKDKDKDNKPWTYASGALARGHGTLTDIDSVPDLSALQSSSSTAKATAPGGKEGSPKAPPDKTQSVTCGDPLAPAKMSMLEREIIAGLRARGVDGDFVRLGGYFASTLRNSAGAYSGSELTGNCRLSWYDLMLRNPLKAPAEAEQITRQWHQAVLSGAKGLPPLLAAIRRKLDLPNRPAAQTPEVDSPKKALEAVEEAIVAAKEAQAASLAKLNPSEVQELSVGLYPVFTSQNNVGHTLNDRGTGRRLCDLLERTDRDAMYQAAEAVLPLINKDFLAQLAKLPEEGNVPVPGVVGRVLRKIDTSAGAIIVGGRGRNGYDFEKMPDVACVIDLGGDDEYREGVASINHPVMVILDLAGSDVYRGSRPGIQGSAILGASLLVDCQGNDVYQGQDVCQGSCIGGVGMLVDFGGDDRYFGYRRAQATALAGLGMVLDYEGDDEYHAAMWGQGLGHPLGFALLDDAQGDDRYYCGGQWRDSYPETPGYEGWGQGVGAGIRQVANGGVGVFLDGEGDDVYEFDYIAHGGGYWCGVGMARDFGGNDQRIGATTKAYSGGARSETEFQRFGCGFGCHYALGFCFDDSGKDSYRGSIMNQGFGWDCAVGALCDFGGDDKYEANGNGTSAHGQGAQDSFGVLLDWDGNDQYIGYGQGYANPGINYHTQPGCGGNFSFMVDYGGDDQYGCGAENNSYVQRGSAGGFLIDRPSKRASLAKDNPQSPTASQETQQARHTTAER